MGRGESFLPHSVLHEKALPTKTVRASRTPTKGQEPGVIHTRQNSGFVRSLIKRVGTVAYISNGVEHASAVQYGITESYEDTINHFPDKKSGRGGWERRAALAGFYGIRTGDERLCLCMCMCVVLHVCVATLSASTYMLVAALEVGDVNLLFFLSPSLAVAIPELFQQSISQALQAGKSLCLLRTLEKVSLSFFALEHCSS